MTRVLFPDAEFYTITTQMNHEFYAQQIYEKHAETRDRTGDLQIFSLALSQLSYRGL